MAALKYRFFEPLPALQPQNTPVAAADGLQAIVGKLQGQITQFAAYPRLFADTTGSATTRSWTVPAGVHALKFRLFGPGAQGVAGQNSGPRSGGGGGGAGALCEGTLIVSPGEAIAYRIPPAGSGSAAYLVSDSGNARIVAGAGAQGTAAGVGGAGGTAAVGSDHAARVLGFSGRNGRGGFSATLALTIHDDGGDGADTPLGAGGRGGKDANGGAASGYGAGGGGCPAGNTPGSAAAAALILEY
ncbi:hypothetical protein D0B54_17930 [Solimonas sp. K1W22B-7]|uniref:hypothetical protein n=1 Tax=Solimonas sp. K1W22B-7 TaxID=2303331 RepID=UPI000E336145|nr:hypothetical protein [Solimonas sp. K1W22B-7]AXQ30440.1 hypothetical protein D0B54_17930 [Solimonas sp. K1W22B-7]